MKVLSSGVDLSWGREGQWWKITGEGGQCCGVSCCEVVGEVCWHQDPETTGIGDLVRNRVL